MPRIFGVDIPSGKRMEIALTYLYGIGRPLSQKILAKTGIDPSKRAKDLSDKEIASITSEIQKDGIKVEGDLKREVASNIKRLKDIKSYRGSRHVKRLPVRGQRTKTNSRTLRGNVRKTMGSGKRKEEKK